MKVFYLITLHGLYMMWITLWSLLLVYGFMFNVSAYTASSDQLSGVIIILSLLIFWTANYVYQIKGNNWKRLIVCNILSFAIPFLFLTVIWPNI